MNYLSQIEEIAYQIWQAEGKPEGQADKHWNQAKVLVDTVKDPHKAISKHKLPSHPQTRNTTEPQQPDQT